MGDEYGGDSPISDTVSSGRSGQVERNRLAGGRTEEGLPLMIDRNAWAPVSPVGRTLGALAKTAALTLALALLPATASMAQTAPRKPPPKPAAPAPQQPPQQPQAQQPQQPGAPQQQQPVQLIYSPWTKFCVKGKEADGKQVCFTGKDARIESGMT